MNRKLKKALKDIYASEQPEHMNEFIHQFPNQKQQYRFSFAVPVTAMLALGVVGGYSFLNARDTYQPYHTVSTEMETLSVTDEFSTIPAESESVINPETTATHSTSETIQTATQTTVTTTNAEIPETTVITESEPEVIMTEPATEPVQEEEPSAQVQNVTTVTETIPETSETQTETTLNQIDSPDMSLAAMIDEMQYEYFCLRHDEVMDWISSTLSYTDAGAVAETMISEWESNYQQNENSFYAHYRQVIKEIEDDNYGAPEGIYVGATAQWTILGDTYKNLLDEEVTQIEAYLTEHNKSEELENFRASQEYFWHEYETFWDSSDFIGFSFTSPHTDYINAVLIQGRVLLVMNYFDEYFS